MARWCPPVIQLGFGEVASAVDESEWRRFGGEHLADAHGLVVTQVVVERQHGRVFVHEHVMGKGHEVHRLSEHGAPRRGARDVGAEGSALSHYTGNRRPMPTYAAAGSMGRDRPTPLRIQWGTPSYAAAGSIDR